MTSKKRHRETKSEPHLGAVLSDKKILKSRAIEKEGKVMTAAMGQMAWQVALGLVLPSLLGVFIDKKAGTEPLFSVIGVFLGFALVMIFVYRIVNKHYPNTFKKDQK